MVRVNRVLRAAGSGPPVRQTLRRLPGIVVAVRSAVLRRVLAWRRHPRSRSHTIIVVYASPIEASDRFFHAVKSILRTAPLVEQEEILIERSEVCFVW